MATSTLSERNFQEGWPATMEGAVRSGDAAAAALLAHVEPELAQAVRQGVAA